MGSGRDLRRRSRRGTSVATMVGE